MRTKTECQNECRIHPAKGCAGGVI